MRNPAPAMPSLPTGQPRSPRPVRACVAAGGRGFSALTVGRAPRLRATSLVSRSDARIVMGAGPRTRAFRRCDFAPRSTLLSERRAGRTRLSIRVGGRDPMATSGRSGAWVALALPYKPSPTFDAGSRASACPAVPAAVRGGVAGAGAAGGSTVVGSGVGEAGCCAAGGAATGGAAAAGGGGGAASGVVAGGAAGAGGGLVATRGGSKDSGSTYVSSSPTRTPRWTYGTSCSGSPDGPGSAIGSPSSTCAPRFTSSCPRCVRDALWPPPVAIVTVSPCVGTCPAKVTSPLTGASTARASPSAMSTPRCCPPA